MKYISLFLQCVLPQHFVSYLMGRLADCRIVWLKNFLISRFIATYQIDLAEYQIKNPHDYACFNDFFIRHLDMKYRPIAQGANAIISPVDGTVAESCAITLNKLIQAKGHDFELEALLGASSYAGDFYDGSFATLYLAPDNYHRVHMPIDGVLKKMIFIPGKLFSVNKFTCEKVANLYSRNERLVCFFETAAGPMALIFVGAMIVGSIQLSWMDRPYDATTVDKVVLSPEKVLKKGDDLGYFKLGSTVILLFGKDAVEWDGTIKADSTVRVGQQIGEIKQSK